MTIRISIPNKHAVQSVIWQLFVPATAALFALAISLLVVALAGKSPIAAIEAILDGALGNTRSITSTMARMVPLTLVAFGWIIAFSTKRVSIGFEGQILAGGAAAAVVGLSFSGLPGFVHLPLCLFAAVLGGALWVALPALMWARNGVHEIITTLLMNLVALEMVSWLVRGPLQEDSGSFARTNPIASSALWPKLLEGTRLHWDIVLVVFLAFAVLFVLKKTTLGLALRFVGANPVASTYLGLKSIRVSVGALLASGGFAGLAGASLVLAQQTSTMSPTFSGGYGYEGIVVALLARNNPIAVIPVAFFFAVLQQGSGLLQAKVGISSDVILLVIGIIVISVSVSSELVARIRSRQPAEVTE